MIYLVTPTPEPEPTGWRARLAAFSELRDTVVFGFSALYVLGYMTWAIYSASRGLGVLPPLEGQYFLAGAIPLLLLCVGYAAIRMLEPAETAEGRKKSLRWGTAAMVVASAVIAVYAILEDRSNDSFEVALLIATVLAMYAGLALNIRAGEAVWMRPVFFVAVPLLVIAGELFYATRVFPFLPGEFGGPRPSCVALDLDVSSLSRETASALGAVTTDVSTPVRSAPSWLHFSGGGLLVVSRTGDPERAGGVPDVLRLSDATVTAFTPAQGCK